MLAKINILRIKQERLSLILLSLWLFFYFASLYRVNDILFDKSIGNQIVHTVNITIFIGLISSGLVLFRLLTKVFLLVAWISLIILIRMSPSLFELHFPILSLLCLLFIFSPSYESSDASKQRLASINRYTLLGIISFNYTLSGLFKLIFFLKISPIGRANLFPNIYQRPELGIYLLDMLKNFSSELYFILALLETACFFLFIKNSFRKYAWLAGVFLQLIILLTCQIGQISLLFIISYVYTFDIDWLKLDKIQNVSSSKS